ncbi:MAG: SOS response-associated peptidase, partial [Pseudaminobacter sp.]|nr:SOS response-associated peptidase [Pseudaminobacter sp.]
FEPVPVRELVNKVANTMPEIQEQAEPSADAMPKPARSRSGGGEQFSLF